MEQYASEILLNQLVAYAGLPRKLAAVSVRSEWPDRLSGCNRVGQPLPSLPIRELFGKTETHQRDFIFQTP